MGLIKRLSREEPAPPWGMIVAVGYVLAAFAAIIFGTTVASVFLGDTPTTFIAGWSVGMIVIALFITITRNRTPQDGEALRLGSPRTPLIIIFMWSIGAAIAFDLLSLAVTRTPWPIPELLRYFDTGVSPFRPLEVGFIGWGLALLFMAIFQPVGEELVFRGLLFPSLRTNLGIWAGFLITAVLYAVFHLLAYAPSGGGGNFVLVWHSLFIPFLNGLYLNGVRALTGSTRAAVVAHAGLGIFAVLRILFYFA